jgi:hypothetical protein
MEQLSPEPTGCVTVDPVHTDETFDHVDDDIIEGPTPEGHGDDGPVGVAAQRAVSSGDPRRGSEGGDAQSGGPGGRAESAGGLGELDGR